MFGTSSSTPKADFGRGYVAAVSGASPTSSRGLTVGRTTAIAVGAAVAVGVSALVGGRLISSGSHCTNDARKPSSTSAATATSSWWQRALNVVLLRRSADDDDDAFASGTGTANLFDDEKTKARQLSKVKPTTAARAPATAAAPPRKPEKSGSPPEPKPDVLAAIGYPADIREREQHIKLVRALLRREAGIEYSDDEDSSSSDSTDVSLNYHFATTMEANARDELLMAFAAFEDFSEGNVFGALTHETPEEGAGELQVNILTKMLEYLDMSNEREKLRYRRIALYRENGRATPASSIDATEGEEDDVDLVNKMYQQMAARCGAENVYQGQGGEKEEEEDEWEDEDPMEGRSRTKRGGRGDTRTGGEDGDAMNEMYRYLAERLGPQFDPQKLRDDLHGGKEAEDEFLPTEAGQQARQFQAMFGPSMMSDSSHAERANNGDSILDRVLGQAPAATAMESRGRTAGPNGRAAGKAAEEDMMEDEWEDDGDEEAFMAYLQQPDDSLDFYSRLAMQQALRDPDNDVRVVGPRGAFFGQDEGEEEEQEEGEEDGDVMAGEPWSRRDKADFERELFGRIFQLANDYTLTTALAEREADEEDTRKFAERQQRRQELRKARAPAPIATPAAVDEDGEEWEDEDEDEWEDEA